MAMPPDGRELARWRRRSTNSSAVMPGWISPGWRSCDCSTVKLWTTCHGVENVYYTYLWVSFWCWLACYDAGCVCQCPLHGSLSTDCGATCHFFKRNYSMSLRSTTPGFLGAPTGEFVSLFGDTSRQIEYAERGTVIKPATKITLLPLLVRNSIGPNRPHTIVRHLIYTDSIEWNENARARGIHL